MAKAVKKAVRKKKRERKNVEKGQAHIQVKNIKKYLLAALFNAPSTMNGYYQAEVNHDMPGLVR